VIGWKVPGVERYPSTPYSSPKAWTGWIVFDAFQIAGMPQRSMKSTCSRNAMRPSLSGNKSSSCERQKKGSVFEKAYAN